ADEATAESQAETSATGGSPLDGSWTPPPRDENPFAAPQTDAFERSTGGHTIHPLEYREITFEQLFSDSFAAFKKTWGLLLLAWLALTVVGFGIGLVFLPLQLAATQAGENAVFLVDAIHRLVSFAWSVFCTPVFARFAVHVVRGDPDPGRGIIPPASVFLHTFLAMLLYSLSVGLGLILLIVPGIILALMFLFAVWIAADREVNAIDAFSISYRATSGNKLTLFAAFLVTYLVGMLLVLVTCGLGVFAVAPFFVTLYTLAYLRCTGQPTVLERQGAPSAQYSL
ncbi:MAG: hypothetical protein D6741_13820, partial [Planctomycetota bacterium]